MSGLMLEVMCSMTEDKTVTKPSLPTVKRLFAVSGNRCAMPDCSNHIVNESSGVVVGKVCHIRGKKPDAKRYDPNQSPIERHGFDNLILLCPICHDIIDTDDLTYTTEVLTSIKISHESRFDGSRIAEPSDEIATALTIAKPSGLRLVNVGIVEPKGEYPRLDIKVLNIGPTPIYVYQAEVKVLRSFAYVEGRKRFRAQPVTYVYDLDLHQSDDPYNAVLDVSQVIDPKDGDRFQIILGHDEINFYIREVLYQLQVGLACSDSNDLILSDPIVLSIPMPKRVYGQRSVPDPEGDARNRRSVAEMVALPGKKSGRVQELAAKLAANERL
jgi:hypothetical protein